MKWEAIVVMHAAAEGVEPEKWLAKRPVEGATVYRKGDPAVGTRKHTLSGFKVDLGSAKSKEELEALLLGHIRQHADLYAEVAKDGGHASAGIGLMVPPMEPRTARLTPTALSALAEANVTVYVTGYPCMDDAEPEEAAQQ